MVDENDSDTDEAEYEIDGIEMPWLDTGRGRGILTEYDRKYLLGDVDLEGQDERNARYRIRDRTYQALLDIIIIAGRMDRDDISQVVEKIESKESQSGDLPAEYLIRLAYQILGKSAELDNTLEQLEQAVSSAIIAETEVETEIRNEEPGAYKFEITTEITKKREQLRDEEWLLDNLEEDELPLMKGEKISHLPKHISVERADGSAAIDNILKKPDKRIDDEREDPE